MAGPLNILMLPDNRQANPYQSLLATSLEKQGMNVCFPQGYRRGLPLFRGAILTQHRYDLIHLHWLLPYIKGKRRWVREFYAIKFLLDLTLVKLFGVKIVWTIHNRVNHESTFSSIEGWVRRNIARLADHIILHNQATSKTIAQEYQFSLKKATVILHGHYRDVYQSPIDASLARKELELPHEGKVFLNLGLLRPYKGIEALLDTWIEHQEKFAEHTLLIVGKASEAYAATLKQKIRNSGLNNIIIIPEFVEDNRIHLFFSAATIVVLPYQNILNSGGLILAMSYGLPVIAPKLSSIPEYLDNADQLLYNPADTQGLLNAMQLAMHVNLEHLSQQVINSCDRLNWQAIGVQTSSLYQQILSSSHHDKF